MRVCVTDIDGSSMEDWIWSATERQVKDSAVAVLGLCQRELTPEELGSKYSTGWAFEKGSVRIFRLQPVDVLPEPSIKVPLIAPDFMVQDPIPKGTGRTTLVDGVKRLIGWGAWR